MDFLNLDRPKMKGIRFDALHYNRGRPRNIEPWKFGLYTDAEVVERDGNVMIKSFVIGAGYDLNTFRDEWQRAVKA